MENPENMSFDEFKEIHSKYFALGYLGPSMSNKFACIALTCYLTNELQKKDAKITCYDVLLKIGKHSNLDEKSTFLKALGAICEDFMYSCDTFPSFGVPIKEMPKRLKLLLDNYLPF